MISSQYLQFISQAEIIQQILETNELIMRKYLRERDLIPDGNLVEIGFDELEESPLETVESIYKQLELGEFKDARPAMEAYLESVSQYKRNTYRPLPGALRERLHSKWGFLFKEFGYAYK